MDIEEDIKKLKELNNLLKFFKTHGWIPNLSRNTNINETIEAIEHILAEREEDKKRIKELEVLEDDLKDKRIAYIDTLEFEKEFIPKQKVKEEFKKLQEDLETVLNMIKEKNAEIEKKDKIIDLMAEWISERCLYIDDYGNSCEIIQDSCNKKENCELCIKQYFERKVENERI